MFADLGFFVGLFLRVVAILLVLFFVTFKQFKEATKPKSGITTYRWLLFAFTALFVVLDTIPAIYLYMLAMGLDVGESVRQVMSMVGNLGHLILAILLVLIFNIRIKEP